MVSLVLLLGLLNVTFGVPVASMKLPVVDITSLPGIGYGLLMPNCISGLEKVMLPVLD